VSRCIGVLHRIHLPSTPAALLRRLTAALRNEGAFPSGVLSVELPYVEWRQEPCIELWVGPVLAEPVEVP
jgi:hypothetical protein